jgi:type I restriction enzyme M protein
MGYIFEELLRRFSEMSNETAGEHYTPREVIRLMVNLLFIEDSKSLSGDKPIRSIYDPACGTGGMLSIAEEHLQDMNPNIVLNVFGQELNDETWAIARSDLMIKGQDPKRITQGNSLTDEDGHAGTLFDYCISNPPYGVDWKKYEKQVKDEAENLGFSGRYGAGLPRISDGSFLFIQHMISKMKPYDAKKKEGGSRIAIILSGSPLFSGQAGSGESEIRKWIIENDWLEGIVAMPDQMFYNTGIGTYVWIISNRKDEKSKGKVRLVDAREFGVKVRKSLGDKRKELTNDAISEITKLYAESFNHQGNKQIKVMSKDRKSVV